MFRQVLVAASLGCVLATASALAAGAPPELDKMRKAFAAAVGKHDVKAVPP